MAQIDFDANAYEPDAGFEPLPAGQYVAHITNSDKRNAKTGNGWYIWLEFEIREGPHAGRKVWMNLNLGNTNTEAVRIANAQLSALCRAVGKMRVADTTELHMLPVEIKVTKREARDGYDASNEVRGFKAAGHVAGVAASPSSPAPAAAPAGPPAKPGEANWRR
jgi:hypothetical protein